MAETRSRARALTDFPGGHQEMAAVRAGADAIERVVDRLLHVLGGHVLCMCVYVCICVCVWSDERRSENVSRLMVNQNKPNQDKTKQNKTTRSMGGQTHVPAR